jgi:thiol-disulfide isomerase/thioredoxin
VLAAEEKRDDAGSNGYRENHFGKILREGFSFSGFERDHLYLNDGGRRFVDIAGLTGIDSDTDGRGSAYADFDNDGDHDIFLTAFQGKAHHLFKNRVGQDAGWIRVALRGAASGPDAWGAIVRVRTSQGTLTKIKSGGAGFVSQSDPRLLFGLGEDDAAQWIEVVWPSGRTERFPGVPARTSILIEEGAGSIATVTEARFELPDAASGRDELLGTLAARPGDAFPDLALVGASGKRTRFADVRRPGRRTLVNLWATYCAPCRREMPELEALRARYADAGADIVGVSLDMGSSADGVPRALKKLGVTYASYTTDESVFPALFAGEQFFIPLTYLVNPDGTIADVFKGWSPQTRRRVDSLLGLTGAEPASR